jgi:hypothetical protein
MKRDAGCRARVLPMRNCTSFGRVGAGPPARATRTAPTSAALEPHCWGEPVPGPKPASRQPRCARSAHISAITHSRVARRVPDHLRRRLCSSSAITTSLRASRQSECWRRNVDDDLYEKTASRESSGVSRTCRVPPLATVRYGIADTGHCALPHHDQLAAVPFRLPNPVRCRSEQSGRSG